MLNQVHSGAVVNYTNATGSDIAAGALVTMGKICGIAINDIANGASGAVSLEGVFRLTKKTAADAIALGTILINNSGVTAASAGTTLDAVIVGRAAATSISGATTVDVKLGL